MKKKWRSKSDYFNSDLPMLSMSILEEYVHGITQSKFCKNKMHGGIAQIEIWSIWKKYIGLGKWQKLIIHQKSILKQKRFNFLTTSLKWTTLANVFIQMSIDFLNISADSWCQILIEYFDPYSVMLKFISNLTKYIFTHS